MTVLLHLSFYCKIMKVGKKGVFCCCYCIMAAFDTSLKLPKGYLLVSCFDRLSWSVCRHGLCITTTWFMYSRELRKPRNYCHAQCCWERGQLIEGEAVYKEGVKGVSQELKWKPFSSNRSYEYQAAEYHLLIIWREIWKWLIAGSWVTSGISKSGPMTEDFTGILSYWKVCFWLDYFQ